jgi:predicted ATP-grasp superfamily ATP-dependent carboligase
MSVIVTNAKNRIAYAIVKSLGEKGVEVYTADFVPLSMSFASRFSKGHFLYPSPFREQEAFIESIIKNIGRLGADVLIPVFEETFLLSKYKETVSRHVRMAIPDYEQTLVAHNKDRWLPIAQRLNIPVPRTVSAVEMRNGNPCTLCFPVLVKPNQGGGAWGIVQADSPKELEGILGQDTHVNRPWERFFVQEKIAGSVYCVAMVMNHGELKGHVVYRQLRDYPFSGGQATLRVSVDHHEAVAHFERLLRELRWHGVCQADFLVDEKTGIPYLIDINPRFWGSLIQGVASGVDFPYLLSRIARDGDVEPVPGFKTGVMTRWIWGDLKTLPQALRQGNNRLGFLKEYLQLFSRPMIYDDFCLKDPLPFFTFGLDFLGKAIKQRTLHPSSHDSLEGIWE